MDLKTKSSDNSENKKILESKKEEAILKDQLKRIIDIKENPIKKVFIPLLNNSKLAFFEAKIKGTQKLYSNTGEYLIESTIDRKINRLNKSLAAIQNQVVDEQLCKNNKGGKEQLFNLKNGETEQVIYNEKQEKIGELTKLNDDLFEIIEDENVSEKIKFEIESSNNKDKEIQENIIQSKNISQEVINKKLEEMKKSRSHYKNKDPNHINFFDLEFL